jgi:hypothetical protein
MSNAMQDLEQNILKLIDFKEDIAMLTEMTDWDDIDPVFMDRLLSISSVYEMRFELLWQSYEKALEEYYIKVKLNESDIDFDLIDKDELIQFPYPDNSRDY